MLRFASSVALTAVSVQARQQGSETVTLLQSQTVFAGQYVEVTGKAALQSGFEKKRDDNHKIRRRERARRQRQRKRTGASKKLPRQEKGEKKKNDGGDDDQIKTGTRQFVPLKLSELMEALTDDDNRAHVDYALDLLTGGEVTWEQVQDARCALRDDFAQMIENISQLTDTDMDMSLSESELAAINFNAVVDLFMGVSPPTCPSQDKICEQSCGLREHFAIVIDRLDTDDSDTLCFTELMGALTEDAGKAEPQDALELLTDAVVNWQELQHARSDRGDDFESMIRGIFDLVDTNKDMSLCVEEFAAKDSRAVVSLFRAV